MNTLVDRSLTSGYHDITWEGRDMHGLSVSAGLYIYTLQTEGVSLNRKMMLMK